VLVVTGMKTAGLAVILVAAASTAASAGTYLGLGLGSSASVGGTDTGSAVFAQGSDRSERFIVGQKFGYISIEGAGTRYGLYHQTTGYDGTAVALAAKLSLPLGNGFDAFGRGGVQRTWLSTDTANAMEYSGNGWLLGGGFEYHLGVSLLGGGSIFVDYERAKTTFDGQAGRPFDNTVSMWTLGLTLSI
jgi:hypothetical protein